MKIYIRYDRLLSITRYLWEEYKIDQPIRIQKILYFLYLDYLKETKGQKLFTDEFQAWVHGPVLQKVYSYIKKYGFDFKYKSNNKIDDVEVRLLKDLKTKNFIDKKIKKYLDLTSEDLIKKSHYTQPWIKARKGLNLGESSKNKISFEDLKEFAINGISDW